MTRFILLVLLFIDISVCAQQTAIFLDPEYHYQKGIDLLDKQKFGAAQKEFQDVLASKENVSETTRGNSSYYIAKCASELYNADAEYLLLNFIDQYPANTNYQDALYDLGIFYYRQKRYKPAIEWLAKIDQTDLDKDKKDEINFKIGYAYYMTNDYDKASKAFFVMKDGNSKYATAAQYYYAHIEYVNQNYETALNSFLKLKDSEAFAPVVPYYITQIYYKQGKYDEILKYAPGLIDTGAVSKNGLEISRMVAESYYQTGKYKEALPYLLDYEKNSPNAGRIDYYDIAFCYYQTGEFLKAANYFQKVVVNEDSLGQNAYFHLADCFLKNGNKRSARNAFQSAGKLSYDKSIQEESQFNFAKLSYELSFQSVAIESFRNFMKNFPNSPNASAANEMLINIYASTHNYKDAIAALEAVKQKSANMQTAYQKVAYYRGVELFMDNNPREAVNMFDLSLNYPMNQDIVAEANYWKGEALYKLNDYEGSVKAQNIFLNTPAALRNDNYNTANYNIGYAEFKMGKYDEAQTAFRKYMIDQPNTDQARFNDALLRSGDCFFMMKDQSTAMQYYNDAINKKAKAGDYALYQVAMIQGVQGKMKDKVKTLQKILQNYPKSVYYDDALYEAGQASMVTGDNELAEGYFRRIQNEYPTGTYPRKAELGEALVLYNTRQDEKAMAMYKNIVKKYPNTDESRQALKQIEKISVSQNKVDQYLDYVKNIPEANLSGAAEDSLIYEAAEQRYTQGNCDLAIKDLDQYLAKFPNAIFRVNANYLKSDCLFRNKKYAEALPGYEVVIKEDVNNFTEKSLLNAGIIYYSLKKYSEAQEMFEKLEGIAKSKDNIAASLSGQLRSAYKINNCEKAIEVSKKVVDSQSNDKDLVNEAHLIAGRCYVQKESLSDAKSELSIVAKRTNSEMTAESKYLLATIEYKMSNYKESQKLILEIQKQNPSYDYWIAKGFILLGDNYLVQKDTFQAKETYKSIVDNYEKDPSDPDELKQIAKEKYDAIVSSEQSMNKEMMEKKKMDTAPEDTTIKIEN